MELTHLRIGNYVRCADACMSNYFQVTADHLVNWSNNAQSFNGWIDPVELNDELILKMGLKFIGSIDLLPEKNYLFPGEEDLCCGDLYLTDSPNHKGYDLRIRTIDDGEYSFEVLKYIHFVHELQNVIIDLLNIELTLNFPRKNCE